MTQTPRLERLMRALQDASPIGKSIAARLVADAYQARTDLACLTEGVCVGYNDQQIYDGLCKISATLGGAEK
jgi:hypothetical protein